MMCFPPRKNRQQYNKNDYRERAPWGDYVHRAARTGSMCTSRRPDGAVDGGLLRRLGNRRSRRSRHRRRARRGRYRKWTIFCSIPNFLRVHASGCKVLELFHNLADEETTVDATSTAYLNSSSRSLSEASSHNVADANARAQSMATPREFTMHSFVETGDAYSSIASTR